MNPRDYLPNTVPVRQGPVAIPTPRNDNDRPGFFKSCWLLFKSLIVLVLCVMWMISLLTLNLPGVLIIAFMIYAMSPKDFAPKTAKRQTIREAWAQGYNRGRGRA